MLIPQCQSKVRAKDETSSTFEICVGHSISVHLFSWIINFSN